MGVTSRKRFLSNIRSLCAILDNFTHLSYKLSTEELSAYLYNPTLVIKATVVSGKGIFEKQTFEYIMKHCLEWTLIMTLLVWTLFDLQKCVDAQELEVIRGHHHGSRERGLGRRHWPRTQVGPLF